MGCKKCGSRYQGCDVLVNCAGNHGLRTAPRPGRLDDTLIENILSTNVRGTFSTVRALLPRLLESKQPGGGVVVNISSIAAGTAMGSNINDCASKAAVDNMTSHWRGQLG